MSSRKIHILHFGSARRTTRACLCGPYPEVNSVRRYMLDLAP